MLKVILSIGAIQAVAIAIQFVRSKIIAVLLGPEGVGVISTIDQIVQFAAFATALSIPLASVKFLSKAHSEGADSFKRTYAGFFQLLAALSFVGTVVAVALVFFRPQFLGAEDGKYRLYLLVALFSLPTFVLGGFFSNVFAAAQKYRVSAALAVITNLVTTTAVIAGVLVSGVFGVFLAGSLASVALTIGITFYLWKKMNLPFFSDGTKSLRELRHSPNVFSFTAMLYFGSVSYSLSSLVARYAILANFGEAETGLLQGALVLSVAIGTVLNPANGLYLTPIMNRGIEKAEKMRHVIEFQRKIIIVLSLVTVPIVMFPQLLLTIMFSNKFAAVGNLVFLFIFAQFITLLAGIYSAFLIGVDDLKIYTAITTSAQLGFSGLAWILAPAFGVKGIAIAGIASSSAIFSLTLIRLKLKHGFSIPRNQALLTAYSLCLVLLIGWLCTRTEELDATAVMVKTGFLFLFVGSLYLFLNDAERSSLRGLRVRFLLGRQEASLDTRS